MYSVGEYIVISQKSKYTFINQAGLIVGRDSSVGIANYYGLDDPGIEPG